MKELLEASTISSQNIKYESIWSFKTDLLIQNSLHKQIFALLVDLMQQEIIKIVLEPQFEAHFVNDLYGFRPGRNHHDALGKLYSSLIGDEQLVANVNLNDSLSKLNYFIYLDNIDINPIIKNKILKWLDFGLMHEYFYQSISFDKHIFDLPRGSILAPLLINFVLNDIYFSIRSNILKKFGIQHNLNIIFYGFHCVLISKSSILLDYSINLLKRWFNDLACNLNNKSIDIKCCRDGFNFLNYHIILFERKKNYSVVPSIQAIQLFNQGNRETIQLLKSAPIKKMINSLRSRILNWGTLYSQYNSKQIFYYVDKVLFSQIRASILRRHPNKSRYWISAKYFPSCSSYYFNEKYYKSSWILTDTNSLTREFVPKMQWLLKKPYIKIVKKRSVYYI